MLPLKRVLSDFTINFNQLQDVFNYNDKKCIGLNKEKYTNIVCENFLTQFKKTVNVKWGNDKGKSIIIDLYCASKECKARFKLSQKKELINNDSQVNFSVKSTEIDCDHKNEKLVRHLKGENRKKIASAVKDKSVETVRNQAIISCDKVALSEGHLQGIHTYPVMRKAASELRNENDKNKDPMYDIFLQANDLKFVHSVEYKHDKFNVTIISSELISIFVKYLTKCNKSAQVSRVHYDATGGILAKPCEGINNLFHHVIVIPMKLNENDQQGTFLNIGEMISSLHTTDQQEIFIRRFIQLASKEIKTKGKIYL